MLLWASKFAIDKIEWSFEICKQTCLEVTFILLLMVRSFWLITLKASSQPENFLQSLLNFSDFSNTFSRQNVGNVGELLSSIDLIIIFYHHNSETMYSVKWGKFT